MSDQVFTADVIFALNQTEEIKMAKAKDLDGISFSHYTSILNIKKILTSDDKGNHFFYVRNIESMNDLREAEIHESEGSKIHSFCTCHTKYERIPLWYMYSGICGKGGRIRFTPGKMIDFIKSIDKVYPVTKRGVSYSKALKIGKDFELLCGWVFYLMNGNNRIIYRNQMYEVQMLHQEDIAKNYFIKAYPWEYEREFRIIIKNKTDKVYERLAIPLPQPILESLEIMSAPEYTFTEEEKEELISRGIKADKIKQSELDIKMDLLRNNKDDIIERMEEWCEKSDISKVRKKLKEISAKKHKEDVL